MLISFGSCFYRIKHAASKNQLDEYVEETTKNAIAIQFNDVCHGCSKKEPHRGITEVGSRRIS